MSESRPGHHRLPVQRAADPDAETWRLLRRFADSGYDPDTCRWLAEAPVVRSLEHVVDVVRPGLRIDLDESISFATTLPFDVGVPPELVHDPRTVPGRRWALLWASCAGAGLTRRRGRRLVVGDFGATWDDRTPLMVALSRSWMVLGYLQRTVRWDPPGSGGRPEAARTALSAVLTRLGTAPDASIAEAGRPEVAALPAPAALRLHQDLAELVSLGLLRLGTTLQAPVGAQAILTALADDLRKHPVAGAAGSAA